MAWPKPMPIVEVEWIDSSSRGRWHDPEDVDAWLDGLDLACRSVGYLYRESEDRVVVVQSQAAVDSVAETLIIPRVVITGMTTLRRVDDR